MQSDIGHVTCRPYIYVGFLLPHPLGYCTTDVPVDKLTHVFVRKSHQVTFGVEGSSTSTGSAGNPLQVLTNAVSNTVLEAVNTVLENKLSTWGEATTSQMLTKVNELLQDTSQDLTKKTAKRIKMDLPDLQKPGNIDQYEHNSTVLRCIEKAESSIIKGDGEASRKFLEEGKKLLLNRQKLIRLADREDDVWLFVKEYTSDKLADGPADEKQMAQARKVTAIKKRDLLKKKNNNKNFYPSASLTRKDQIPTQSISRYYSQPRQQNQSSCQSNKTFGTDFRRDNYDRDCHKCGRRGHLSYNCPRNGYRA